MRHWPAVLLGVFLAAFAAGAFAMWKEAESWTHYGGWLFAPTSPWTLLWAGAGGVTALAAGGIAVLAARRRVATWRRARAVAVVSLAAVIAVLLALVLYGAVLEAVANEAGPSLFDCEAAHREMAAGRQAPAERVGALLRSLESCRSAEDWAESAYHEVIDGEHDFATWIATVGAFTGREFALPGRGEPPNLYTAYDLLTRICAVPEAKDRRACVTETRE